MQNNRSAKWKGKQKEVPPSRKRKLSSQEPAAATWEEKKAKEAAAWEEKKAKDAEEYDAWVAQQIRPAVDPIFGMAIPRGPPPHTRNMFGYGMSQWGRSDLRTLPMHTLARGVNRVRKVNGIYEVFNGVYDKWSSDPSIFNVGFQDYNFLMEQRRRLLGENYDYEYVDEYNVVEDEAVDMS